MRALDGVERQERSLAAAAVGGDGEARRALEKLARQRAALESEALGLAPSALSRGVERDSGSGDWDGARPRASRDRIDGALERIAGHLSPEVAILKFHVGEKASHLFVLTREHGEARVVHHVLPGRAALAALVQRYVGAIGTAPDRRSGAQRRAMGEDGKALFRELVEPALAAIGDRTRVVFVPHRELRLVPFDALPWPVARGGGWLAERFVTSTGPSLAALVTLEQSLASKASHPRYDIAAFGDPVYSQTALLKLPRLEATVAEVKLASQLIQRSGHHPDAGAVFLGADASEARLKALALSRYRVLHLATHGFAPDQMDALKPGDDGKDWARGVFGQPLLVLGAGGSEDGLLTIDEVLGLNLDADLVVLSACSSGRGALEPGDGLGGLVNAFLYAGSAGVLATLWPIEDRHAAAMMETFYREIGRGQRPVFALGTARTGAIARAPDLGAATARDAGLQMRGMGGITGEGGPRPEKPLRGGARRVDPFFWAAWVLNGAVGDLFE
jgi:CHAT domain-containing protein